MSWHNESLRHAKARMGIKTGQKSQKQSNAQLIMQLKKREPFKDFDGDGKVNKFDCNPIDKNRQDRQITIVPTYVPSGEGNDSSGGKRDLKYKIKEWGYIFSSPEEAKEYADTHYEENGTILEKKNTKKNDKDKLLEPFKKPKWTEQEVNLALRRINAKKITPTEIFDNNKDLYDGNGVQLTEEQNKKGYDFLINQWKSPTGKERTNNPFGERETSILENFREIRLKDFYSERGNFYVPLYAVYSKEGDSMEYYYSGGKVSIVG